MSNETRPSSITPEYIAEQRDTNHELSRQAHAMARDKDITVEVIYGTSSYFEQLSHCLGGISMRDAVSSSEAFDTPSEALENVAVEAAYIAKIREYHSRHPGEDDLDFYFAFNKDLDKTVGRAFDFMIEEIERSGNDADTLRARNNLNISNITHLQHQLQDYASFNARLQRDIVKVCHANLWQRICYLFSGRIGSLL